MKMLTTNPIKQSLEKNFVNKITNIISSIGFISEKDKNYTLSDHIDYLLKASESSDQKGKIKIENHIVKLGKKAVPGLVKALYSTTGQTRGMIAMSLIRIGSQSISYLEKAAGENQELSWMAEYIIREIQGSQHKITSIAEETALEPAMVC